MKLSDTQLVILSAAAKHEMGLARAPKGLPAAARNAVFRSLIKSNLLTEINAQPDHVGLGWRQDEDGTSIVARITDEGLRAIGIDPSEGNARADTAPTGAEEPAPPHEDAAETEATQDAPQGDDDTDHEDNRPRHERLGVDPALIDGPDDLSYQPIERALIRAIGTITAHAADQHAWSRFCTDHADLVAALRTVAVRKPARTPREPGAPRKPREGTKQETVLALLRRDEGATIAHIVDATGWQSHTVRGFLTGLKRKGITVEVMERIRQVGPNKEGAKGSFSIDRIAG